MSALAHLRVVELCDDIPAAACARQFAAWGADVLTVEPPSGSPLRRLPPLVEAPDGERVSLVWEYLGANKRVFTLDLDDAPSRARFHALIAQADVFVTDRPPAWLARTGLDYSSLAGSAPGLVMVAISPFGSDGPYAGYAASDLVVQALSGILSLSGEPGGMPLKVAANILPLGCGVSAFIGALAALRERQRSGAGQLVEVATLEAVASLVLFLRTQYFGAPFPRRLGVSTALLRCMDGHVLCNPRAQQTWDLLLLSLRAEPETVPEALQTPEGRQDTEALLGFMEERSRRWPAEELFRSMTALGLTASILRTPADLLSDEHLAARGYFRILEHPTLGALAYPGPAGQMSATPAVTPAPLIATAAPQPRALLWREKPAARKFTPPAADSAGAGPPLRGVRVLDLTTAWIGPYAGMLLADLGADVIKIEGPNRPDVWRFFHMGGAIGFDPPPVARPGSHPGNTCHYFNSVNRNKRDLALDLASARGKALFLELVAEADIILENFTPRVLENFGLGYETLRAGNPGIILVSFSGYGASGPYRDVKATGAMIETIAGWVSLFGYPGEPPVLMGEMEADPLSGLHAAAQALVALAHRDRTGEGQRIDGSMFEAAAGYIGEELLLASFGGNTSHPRGNRDRVMAPQGVFPCAGSDQWLALTVRDDADWRALLTVAGDAPALRDGRFQTAAARLAHVEEIERAISHWTRRHEARALMAALQGAGVPAGRTLTTDEAPQDPHFVARGWFRPLTHPDTGTQLHNGYPWRFSRSSLVWRSPPPRLGEQSAAVLRNELGLSDALIGDLFERGVTIYVAEETDAPPVASG